MPNNQIEAILGSPPEREVLVVQLFEKGAGQWAEVFREDGEYWVEIHRGADLPSLRFESDELIAALRESVDSLRERLDDDG